jgi:hypothetical protein
MGIKQLAKEKQADYKTAANVYNVANELIKYKDKTKEVLKSVVESSKKHLEAIFSKITGNPYVKYKKSVQRL